MTPLDVYTSVQAVQDTVRTLPAATDLDETGGSAILPGTRPILRES